MEIEKRKKKKEILDGMQNFICFTNFTVCASSRDCFVEYLFL